MPQDKLHRYDCVGLIVSCTADDSLFFQHQYHGVGIKAQTGILGTVNYFVLVTSTI